MRLFQLAVPVCLMLSLAACTGPVPGAPRTLGGAEIPTGYHPVLLKPRPAVVEAVQSAPLAPPTPPAPAAPSGAAWNEITDYVQWTGAKAALPTDIDADLAPIGATLPVSSVAERPVAEPAAPGAAVNADVSVFPLDGGDAIAVARLDPLPAAAARTDYGTLRQKIFFAHASARVKKGDRARLRGLARKNKAAHDLSVTVVGHASRRVDRVKDPVKKKMINFRMAQRRADAVTHELKKAGLKPAWVQAVSKGDEEPNDAPPDGMGREAADRRVDVYMDGK